MYPSSFQSIPPKVCNLEPSYEKYLSYYPLSTLPLSHSSGWCLVTSAMGAHALPRVWLHFPPLCHCEASSVTNWLCVKAPNTHTLTNTHTVNGSLGNKAQRQPLFFCSYPPIPFQFAPRVEVSWGRDLLKMGVSVLEACWGDSEELL